MLSCKSEPLQSSMSELAKFLFSYIKVLNDVLPIKTALFLHIHTVGSFLMPLCSCVIAICSFHITFSDCSSIVQGKRGEHLPCLLVADSVALPANIMQNSSSNEPWPPNAHSSFNNLEQGFPPTLILVCGSNFCFAVIVICFTHSDIYHSPLTQGTMGEMEFHPRRFYSANRDKKKSEIQIV